MILQFTDKDEKLETNEMRKMTCTEDSLEWKQSVLIHGHSLVGWNKVGNVIKVLLLNDKDGIDYWREQRMGQMIDKGKRCYAEEVSSLPVMFWFCVFELSFICYYAFGNYSIKKKKHCNSYHFHLRLLNPLTLSLL